MFEAVKFYQGFNGIEFQAVVEQDLINAYASPNCLGIVIIFKMRYPYKTTAGTNMDCF